MNIVVALINGMIRLIIAIFQITAKLLMFGIRETQRALARSSKARRR